MNWIKWLRWAIVNGGTQLSVTLLPKLMVIKEYIIEGIQHLIFPIWVGIWLETKSLSLWGKICWLELGLSDGLCYTLKWDVWSVSMRHCNLLLHNCAWNIYEVHFKEALTASLMLMATQAVIMINVMGPKNTGEAQALNKSNTSLPSMGYLFSQWVYGDQGFSRDSFCVSERLLHARCTLVSTSS